MTPLTACAAAAVATVLAIAGAAKLADPKRFARALATHRWPSRRTHAALVRGVPAAELTVAAALWVPAARSAAAALAVALLGAFTAVLVHARVTGSSADCGCLGTAAPEPVTWWSVARNAVLLAAAAVVVADPGPSGPALPALATGVTAGLLLVVVEHGLNLFSTYWTRAEEEVVA